MLPGRAGHGRRQDCIDALAARTRHLGERLHIGLGGRFADRREQIEESLDQTRRINLAEHRQIAGAFVRDGTPLLVDNTGQSTARSHKPDRRLKPANAGIFETELAHHHIHGFIRKRQATRVGGSAGRVTQFRLQHG